MNYVETEDLLWQSCKKENSDTIFLSQLTDEILKVTPNGTMREDSTKALCSFLIDYTNKLKKPINVVIDCRKICSINNESKQWLAKSLFASPKLKRVVSFGNNMFINNTLTVLISFIAKHGNSYINYPTEQEAFNSIIKI